ncbi:MAG: DegQ family serine endoprotease [Pseudomonadota bacterium]|nr:MAG: protease [Pseudomonadota bacterium]
MIEDRHSKTLALILATALSAFGCSRAMGSPAQPDLTAEPKATVAQPVPVTTTPDPILGKGAYAIADVAERALPSVVNISLTKVGRRTPIPFPFFFGPPEERIEQGMGSGVIVSADGTILTNNHVVADAKEIKVTTYDRREFDAKVIGTDPKSDLAVIQIQGAPEGLTPIQFGDSSKLRLGEIVLAIGNPFGVGQTVTMGIVSAKGRADLGIVDYEDFIQTDAAINPGNSGGALINMEGKLVGINTAILSRSGGYQGIGFAIPTNMALPIMQSLKANGRVVRGWLGVGIQEVDSDLAAALKLPVKSGIVLSDVQPGSPAARAGLRRGDVIVKLDGKPVTSLGQFRNSIAIAGANRKVTLDIYRDGKPQSVSVQLGEMPNEPLVGSGAKPSTPSGPSPLDGISLAPLTPEHRRAFRVPGDVTGGVIVTNVSPGSSAARAGLRPGDVILEVNRQPVNSLEQFQAAYAKSQGRVLLLVNRGGNTVFMVVKR